MKMRRSRYTFPWFGAATWAAASAVATVVATDTPHDVLSWGRRGAQPTVIERGSLAAVAPALIGAGGLIVLLAFVASSTIARRSAVRRPPPAVRALRADGAIAVLSAIGLMMLHLVRTVSPSGQLQAADILVALLMLAGGLTVSGLLCLGGALSGLARDDPGRASLCTAGAGLACTGALTMAVGAAGSLTSTATTAVIALAATTALTTAFSVRSVGRRRPGQRTAQPEHE